MDLKVPDLLAYRVDMALAILAKHGFKYKIEVTKPPRMIPEECEGEPSLYVVRQSLAADQTICLISSYRFRKEVQ
ncbi:MAG: PASTA domain-containing protein [Acidaminococcaceae bacterium]